jgi:hypothetical protein
VQVSGSNLGVDVRKDEMRRLFAIAIAIVVLSACGGDSGAAVTQTNVKTFVAWKSDGSAPLLKVANNAIGSCFGASAVVDAAFRCFAGSEILEPCFAPPSVPNPNVVACARDPWSDLTLVNINGGLPESTPATTSNPRWAMELENKDRCVSLGVSSSDASNGVVMRFACNSRSTATDFDKASQPWVVQYNKNNISFDLVPVNVAEAW